LTECQREIDLYEMYKEKLNNKIDDYEILVDEASYNKRRIGKSIASLSKNSNKFLVSKSKGTN